MLGYCTIGVSDMDRATAFYDALLGVLGARMMFDMGRIKGYGVPPGYASLAICIPYNEEPQSPGNGNMVAIPAASEEQVDKLHARAIELGGTDEGAPGARLPTFYGAYVRDLDGNKLCFFRMRSAESA